MAEPVARFRPCWLTLCCTRCRDKREVLLAPLIQPGREDEKMAQFVGRLRCRACAQPPSFVRLQTRPEAAPPGTPPLREIILVGPGAF